MRLVKVEVEGVSCKKCGRPLKKGEHASLTTRKNYYCNECAYKVFVKRFGDPQKMEFRIEPVNEIERVRFDKIERFCR